MAAQLGLLGREPVAFDTRFAELVRRELSDGAWIEHGADWVRGHEALCEELEESIRWKTGTQWLFEREVETPRLIASIQDSQREWPLLWQMSAALSERYGVTFDRITFALYRTGEDSVAWHRDRILRQLHSGVVATVSLGDPRTFLMRPRGGGPSLRFQLGWGDLFVMGGTCQRTWEHTVPKTKRSTGRRIAIMFRHSEQLTAT